MTKIHQSAIMSAPTTSQYAAITALKECDGEIDRMRDNTICAAAWWCAASTIWV